MQTTARHRVPVVSDTHAQAPYAKKAAAAPRDPLRNVAVVEDDIGSPVALPAAPAARNVSRDG